MTVCVRSVSAGSPGPGRCRRRVRDGAGRRSGTASGSRPGGRCGCGCCCRARVRGGRGTRRSTARRCRRSPASRLHAGVGRRRSRAAAEACRGRRRWCGGWRGAGGEPVGEERLQGRGERGHGRLAGAVSSRCGGQLRAARARRADTSRCGRLDVPEIGGQQRQPGVDVAAVAVPVEQGGRRSCAGYGEFPISAIRWTAGLCALPGRFAWWGPRRSCFRPHNPDGRCHRPSESSQPIREVSEVQSGRTSGVSGW